MLASVPQRLSHCRAGLLLTRGRLVGALCGSAGAIPVWPGRRFERLGAGGGAVHARNQVMPGSGWLLRVCFHKGCARAWVACMTLHDAETTGAPFVLGRMWLNRDRLSVKPEDFALLVTEPTHNTRAARERLVELVFETFQAPALYVAKNAMLSCFATARQTALVVDSGYRATTGEGHCGFVLLLRNGLVTQAARELIIG